MPLFLLILLSLFLSFFFYVYSYLLQLLDITRLNKRTTPRQKRFLHMFDSLEQLMRRLSIIFIPPCPSSFLHPSSSSVLPLPPPPLSAPAQVPTWPHVREILIGFGTSSFRLQHAYVSQING